MKQNPFYDPYLYMAHVSVRALVVDSGKSLGPHFGEFIPEVIGWEARNNC